MANLPIPISQLANNPTITIDDYTSVVDSASLTTYRVSIGTVNTFFAESGSNLSASFTSESISTSFDIFTDTASWVQPIIHLMTSSWAVNVNPTTVVGTSSLAYHALTASRLEGIGSSYENDMIISESLMMGDGSSIQVAPHLDLTSSQTIPEIKADSVFFPHDYSLSDGFGKIFFNKGGVNRGKTVFGLGGSYVNVSDIGPDIDSISKTSKGILFQTDEAGGGGQKTSSLVYVRENGRTYTRYAEALEYSSSRALTNQSFYGTASFALFASFSLTSPTQWPLGALVMYAGTPPTSPAWTNWTASFGQTYNTLLYPDFMAQTGTSYCTQTFFTETAHPRGTHELPPGSWIEITITSGGSGLFSLQMGANTWYLNAITGYTYRITGLVVSTAYTYTLTDYGYTGNVPSQTNIVNIGAAGGPNVVTPRIMGFNGFRVPQMFYHFRTYAVVTPLSWMVLMDT